VTSQANLESIVAMGYMAYDQGSDPADLCLFEPRTPAWEAWQKGWRQAERDADAQDGD